MSKRCLLASVLCLALFASGCAPEADPKKESETAAVRPAATQAGGSPEELLGLSSVLEPYRAVLERFPPEKTTRPAISDSSSSDWTAKRSNKRKF